MPRAVSRCCSDKPATIETIGGILETEPAGNSATVLFNPPAFDWEFIPLAMPMDTLDDASGLG